MSEQDEAEKDASFAILRTGELRRTVEAKDKEIAALKADNAVLVSRIDSIARHLRLDQYDAAQETALSIERSRHPGAALLEKLRKHEEAIKALADALEAERSLTGVECQCVYAEICVSCQGSEALRLIGRYP